MIPSKTSLFPSLPLRLTCASANKSIVRIGVASLSERTLQRNKQLPPASNSCMEWGRNPISFSRNTHSLSKSILFLFFLYFSYHCTVPYLQSFIESFEFPLARKQATFSLRCIGTCSTCARRHWLLPRAKSRSTIYWYRRCRQQLCIHEVYILKKNLLLTRVQVFRISTVFEFIW